jgi:hypothetical protein
MIDVGLSCICDWSSRTRRRSKEMSVPISPPTMIDVGISCTRDRHDERRDVMLVSLLQNPSQGQGLTRHCTSEYRSSRHFSITDAQYAKSGTRFRKSPFQVHLATSIALNYGSAQGLLAC